MLGCMPMEMEGLDRSVISNGHYSLTAETG